MQQITLIFEKSWKDKISFQVLFIVQMTLITLQYVVK